MTPHRWIAALLCCTAAGCTQQPLPLQQPLAPQLALANGLRVVLLDADLPALADSVRLAAGKSLSVSLPVWPLPNAADGQFTAFAATAPLDGLTLDWQSPQQLRLMAQIGKIQGEISLVPTGQAGCGLSWKAQSVQLQLDAEVVRTAGGALTVQAVGTPIVVWQGAAVDDPSACLGAQLPSLAVSLADHLRSGIAAALADRLSQAFLPSLATIFAASLEQSGRVAIPTTPAIEARFALAYQEAAGHLVTHAGALAQGNLAVSLDVDRHACAVDVPLPTAEASPLAQTSAPAGQAFFRRALVLDQALIQRLAWTAARSGALCARTRNSLTTSIVPGWAADLLPQVNEWIDGSPTSARFWPGSSPATRLIDTPAGPAIEWTMDDGQLEIIANVADTEMTVLVVTGGFRATLLPRLQGMHALAFDVVSVQRLATHQFSPLLGDFATPPSETALSALCEAALQGIFAQQAVLPLLALSPGPLPSGTVLTHVAHVGDALWLWLEGGQAQ